jgi:hypothetical protein
MAAENFEEAKAKIKLKPEFKAKRMHVDGILEIQAVEGFKIELSFDESLCDQTHIVSLKHRDLAPKASS